MEHIEHSAKAKGHSVHAGWTTFPNQRTQYPAQVRVEVYNQCPSLSERSV